MIRKALISDAEAIHKLITQFAKKGVMLGRSLNSIYEGIRDFWVAVDDKNQRVVGCAALHIIGWEGLAEIRSLSVNKNQQKHGYGRLLINECVKEAMGLGIYRVFALTFVPDFFYKQGFKHIEKDKLPHKIWSDCIDCPFFPDCKEIAVIKQMEQ
jgi:amino-acid N-acetyltransferase